MEEKKRHIELAVVSVDGDQVTFRIAEQTHRCGDFAPKGPEFKSSSGYRLISESYPVAGACIDGLFVRGWLRQNDDAEVTANLEFFARIMESITEYNETNGKGYETPWPQDGDNYFFINSDSAISAIHYTHDCTDEMRSSFGNFFRTREEAEAALERVRKALKGVDENKLLREALEEAVSMYGKPGGPWNVPGDAGGWISKARKALEVENE